MIKLVDFERISREIGCKIVRYCPSGYIRTEDSPEIWTLALKNFEEGFPKNKRRTLVYGAMDPNRGAWFLGSQGYPLNDANLLYWLEDRIR